MSPMTDAQRRAHDKYDAQHYATISAKVTTEEAAIYKAAAQRAGLSISAFIRVALDKLAADYPDPTNPAL